MPKKDKKDNGKKVSPTPEQRKEQERNEYIAELEQTTEAAKKPYETLQKIYGPKGKMPSGMEHKDQYDDIKVAVSPEADANFVTAVTLGAMMDPSRLDRNMTTSGFIRGSLTYVSFNRTFLAENVPAADERHGEFPPLMVQGRYEAQQAVSDLIDKKSEQAYIYLNYFMQYAADCAKSNIAYSAGNMTNPVEYTGTRIVIRMAKEFLTKEPYRSHITISEFDRMKIMATAHQAEVREQLLTEKSALMKNPPAAGTKEREDAVAELMFKEYLIGTLSNEKNDNSQVHQRVFEEILERHGVDPGGDEYFWLVGTPAKISALNVPLMNNVQDNYTSDREVILSRPDGVETLRAMYMESIRNTDTFKKLVAAEGTEFQDQLIQLDKVADKGFRPFRDVKTKGEAEPLNQLNREVFNRENEKIDTLVGEMLEDFARRKNLVTAYDAKNLSNNRKRVEKYFDEFTGTMEGLAKDKTLSGEKNLQDIRKGLSSLLDQARSMEKSEKASEENRKAYVGTIDRIETSIQAFFTANGTSPTEERQPLYRNLRRLSRHLAWNKSGIMEPERQKEREAVFRENENTYEKPSPAGIDAMLRIRREQLTIENNGASVGRKELIRKAITATEKLAEIIKAGKPLEGETKQEALAAVRDILGERLYAAGEKKLDMTDIHFAERYSSKAAEKLPEYQAITEKLTMTDLGQIAFHGRADRMVAGYDQERITEMYSLERNQESKTLTAGISQEVERRRAEKEAEKKRQIRETYRKDAALRKADYRNPIKQFHKIYGSKPDMPAEIKLHEEYNQLRVENPPKDLDENTITAIVLGAIMQEKWLNQKMTTSSFRSGTTTFVSFNRNFLIDNLLTPKPDAERQGSFPIALVEGRKEALQAIEDYRNGHPEKAKEYLGIFIDFTSEGLMQDVPPWSFNMTKSSASTVQKALFQLGAEMVGKPPFYAEGKQTEVHRIHGAANEQTMKAMSRVYESKYDILTKPKPAGSKERAQEIENLLFDQYLMSTLHHTNAQKDQMSHDWVYQVSFRYGEDQDYDPNTFSYLEDNLAVLKTQQMWNCRENLLTDHEVLLSTEQGIEKLRQLYMPEIRKTKLYKDLISAKGDDYEELIEKSENETSYGLQSFKQVKLPNLADAVNEKNRPIFDKRTKELETEADEMGVKTVREMQEFDGYDKESLQNNAKHVQYLKKLMNRSDLNNKNLPKPAKAVIGELKKAVKTFTDYATELAKRKDKITISDMVLYDAYAKDIKRLSDGYTSNKELPKDRGERRIFLAIRRVGFMAKVNADLVTAPAREEDRKLNMADAMNDRDENRAQDVLKKHPDIDRKSADYKYAVLSPKALKTLSISTQDALKASKYGESAARKLMIDRSAEAVKSLTRMINKGEDYLQEHQNEAKDLLRDVFAERILARFDKNRYNVPEAENFIRPMTEKIPAFAEAMENVSIGTIGTFLFENRGDKILDGMKYEDLKNILGVVQAGKSNDFLAEIEKREKALTENKNEIIDHSENKNEIIDDSENKNEIIDDSENKNEIIDHSENKNEIIDDSENKNEIIDHSENKNEIIEEPEKDPAKDSKPDQELRNQKEDASPAAVPKKKKKGVPQKEEEPKAEGKPVIEEEPKVEVKPEVKEEPKPVIEEEPKPVIEEDLELVIEEEPKAKVKQDLNNLIREDDSLLDLGFLDRPKNGPEQRNAEAFIKNVHLFGRARQNLLAQLRKDMRPYTQMHLNPFTSPSKDLNRAKALSDCALDLASDAESPRSMYLALQNLSMVMDHLDPDNAVKYRLMASVLGEALKPLLDLGTVYPPLKSKNGEEESFAHLKQAVKNVKDEFGMAAPTKGTVDNAYRELENKTKAKYVLWDSLEKATGEVVDTSPVNRNPNEALIELAPPENIKVAANRCVAKAFLAKAEEPGSTTVNIRGLDAVVKGGGFKAQVNELEKNPIFRKVVSKHPNHYYNHWQRILNRAEEQKQKAAGDLSRLEERGGIGGLGSYIAYGHAENDMMIIHDGPQDRTLTNARMAQVFSAKLLADPFLSTLRQAVGAGVIKPVEVAIEVMDYVEQKNIRVLDQRGNIDRNFQRKLENGDFTKDIIKSQTKFLAKAKNRSAEQKLELQRKLNTVKKPAANMNPV